MSMPDDSSRTALVAGATGLIGRALVRRLLSTARYQRVHLLLRRPATGFPSSERLKAHTVDFEMLPTTLPEVDDVYCCIGTTIKAAGSEVALRHVDFYTVVRAARAAWTAGADRLAVVSALGADPKSRVFYNRVKGEMEEAIRHIGYTSVVIARPSLLAGDRASLGQPMRPLEQLALRLLRPVKELVPRNVRPIEAETVAQAMLDAMLEAKPGVRVLSSGAMQANGSTTLGLGTA
jgi:uncharacterized protein YbjT (DUF2867 family)